MNFKTLTRSAPLVAVSLLAACAAPQGMRSASAPAVHPVEVGIIALNDFHGALEPPKAAVAAPDGKGGTIPVPSGGAAWLASAVDTIKAKHRNHVVVAAGDLTSASQLASSLHLDEPAVGVMNRIGLDFNAVGNHEFDRGWKELQRLQNGGCEKNTRLQPCQLEQFQGARYKYLSASTYKADGGTLFPATGLKSFGSGASKVTVGFIGLSLRDVPTLVSPDEVKGLTFGDEAEAINREVPRLKAEGADAVVVLIHQGGITRPGDPNGCDDLVGGIKPILDKLKPGVDLVVSGHTHWQYVCHYGRSDADTPILLTSAGVYGKLVTDITLTIDPARHRVIAKKAHNVIVQSVGYSSGRGDVPNTKLYPQFSPRKDVSKYVAAYVHDAKDLIARPVGKLAGPAAKPSSESNMGGALGNLIADSQLAASRKAGAQIAFTNPFGIRAPLDPAPDGTVTFGQIYAVQPFNNDLVTMTLTGSQLYAVIEEGLDDDGARQALSPSAGLMFAFDLHRPAGSRLVSLTLNGEPVDPAATYRVTVVNFLAEGGDGFSTFKEGTDRVRGMIDNEALQQWIAAVPVREVPQDERTVQVGD
ncbi:bifunctional metallophosphatase/5'-nucleotidase [Novosphingobium mangrovi (ex Huang et al. 2023)]|uniref:Bifunctional metallophosphatase/5'-nucleotidase n=1 Tax=Novosphingobium mangrovi (ex Huang et al. 2023) TaxID=2976432 RepID=A0ABT2I3C7_9SPHN|nr:bifunctional metallophosphatase/5'-nucleotidase [Novosphingobium mangrovi (ex Huang et al. 2023)]MCT2399295.1 bifunctional metallophosphatase/5'-nucleotidase [Novosphingobium mangrovi (ex Huang et al. 2023)]